MNERILELLEQAGFDVKRLMEPYPGGFPREDMLALESFALLIVRECLGCCEQVISDPVPESVDTWLNGGEQCIQEIKEHFGMGMSVEDKKQLIKDLLEVNK